MNRVLLVIVGLMALTFLRAESSGCDSSLVGDPTMDMWCGKTLCAWTIDKGDVQRVATWHRSDYGVALVGDEVILSQLSSQGLHDSDCLEFRLQADHDDGVNLFIEMDLFADGVVDYSQPFGSDQYRPSIFHLKPPMTLQLVRFVVRKAGGGAATLAEVKVKKVGSQSCAGVQPISLSDLADGTPCAGAAQCSGHRCVKTTPWSLWFDTHREVCSSCTAGGYCPSGTVCGVTWGAPASYLHRACVARGSRQLGERCGDDAQCAGKICCASVCSSCCTSSSAAACTSGSCGVLPWSQLGNDFQYTPRPNQCSPGGGLQAAGERCLRGADCASSSCKGSGALKVCKMDGRTCKDDKDCPFDSGKCLELGQANGLCQ